jgi:hypothetical protein
MISRMLTRTFGLVALLVMGASLSAPVGLDAQEKTKEKAKDPVGKEEKKLPTLNLPLELKEMYVYEIEVSSTEFPVSIGLVSPTKMVNGKPTITVKPGMPSVTVSNDPKVPTVYRSKLRVFVDSKEGGQYTLNINSTDEKKPIIGYTLTLKAEVTR